MALWGHHWLVQASTHIGIDSVCGKSTIGRCESTHQDFLPVIAMRGAMLGQDGLRPRLMHDPQTVHAPHIRLPLQLMAHYLSR